jgi:hypothetical protein
MARGAFALGLVIGGLGGLAAGYVISRNGQPEAEAPAGAIDLTNAISKNETPGSAVIEPAAVARPGAKKEKE